MVHADDDDAVREFYPPLADLAPEDWEDASVYGQFQSPEGPGPMSVSLAPEIEQQIRDKVASGHYPSASEVVREALQLLEDRDRLAEVRLEGLRGEVAIGIEQADRGQLVPLDMESVRAKVRERLAEVPQEGACRESN